MVPGTTEPAPEPLSIVEQLEQRYPDGVLTDHVVTCAPRSDDEWYRTDHTLAIDPNNPEVMYVSIEWLGVYKTIDGGASWSHSSKGIRGAASESDPAEVCHGEYPTIRIDPNDSDHLVLATSGGGGGHLSLTEPNSQTGGLYHSIDAGASWRTMIGEEMNLYATDAVFGPQPGGAVYYSSSSNPGSWQEADQDERFVETGLVYATYDRGGTWAELPTCVGSRTSVTRILLNAADPDQIVVPTYSAVRLSADGTGTGLSNGKDTNVTQLGILSTSDGGRSWSTLPGSESFGFIFGAAAPNHFEHQYFVPSVPPGVEPTGLFTLDGLTLQPGRLMEVAAYDPYDPAGLRLLGFTSASVGPAHENLTLHESLDGGATWTRFGTLPAEITDPMDRRTRVSAITWHPSEPGTIFLNGAGGHVWKSVDGGQSWTTLLSATSLTTP